MAIFRNYIYQRVCPIMCEIVDYPSAKGRFVTGQAVAGPVAGYLLAPG